MAVFDCNSGDCRAFGRMFLALGAMKGYGFLSNTLLDDSPILGLSLIGADFL